MWKYKLLLLMVFLLAGCTPVTKAQSPTPGEVEGARSTGPEAPAAEAQTEPVEEQWPDSPWLDVSLGPPLIDWFNATARPNDIARVEHVSQVDLLDEVNVGRKLVIFKSASDAERLVPRLVSKIDIIGYNLEHGPTNPADEQAQPIDSAKRMRALADKYGLELALGPDHSFALSDAAAMAPYVDIIVLQVQRAQTDHETVREFVLPLAQEIRAANPDIELSVQVRTEGDVVAIGELIDSMRDELAGISILTSPETTDVAEALVKELRPVNTATAPQPTAFMPTQLPKEAAKPRQTPTPAPPATVEPSVSATEQTPSSDNTWLVGAGFLVFGLLLSGVVAVSLVFGYRSLKKR